jgi:glycosyltransferase involved in cell wall biosynthesis
VRRLLAPLPSDSSVDGPRPLFSVITAVRNGAATIATALESVRAQSIGNLEHIVVDGQSTDGTVEIVRERNWPHVRLMVGRDSGVYDAFNKGLRLSRGRIIAFLNADDFYVDSSVLERVLAAFDSKRVDYVYGDVEYVRSHDLTKVVRSFRSASFSRDNISLGFMPAHPATFAARELYERYGEFDDTYRIAGDFEFAARVFGLPNVTGCHLQAVLTRMRVGGLSTRGLRSKLLISQEIVRACRQNQIDTSLLRVSRRFLSKLMEIRS